MVGKRMGDSQVPLSTDASSVMTDWTMCVPQPALLYMVQGRSTSVALRFRPVYAAFPNAPLKRPQAPLIYAPYHRYHHRKLPISRAERVMPDPPTQRCPAPVLLPALPSRRAASSGWLLGLRHHRPDERHAPASTAAGHRSGQLRARDHERHGGARYTSRRPAPRSSDARTGRPCAAVLIGSRAPCQSAAPMTRARAPTGAHDPRTSRRQIAPPAGPTITASRSVFETDHTRTKQRVPARGTQRTPSPGTPAARTASAALNTNKRAAGAAAGPRRRSHTGVTSGKPWRSPPRIESPGTRSDQPPARGAHPSLRASPACV